MVRLAPFVSACCIWLGIQSLVGADDLFIAAAALLVIATGGAIWTVSRSTYGIHPGREMLVVSAAWIGGVSNVVVLGIAVILLSAAKERMSFFVACIPMAIGLFNVCLLFQLRPWLKALSAGDGTAHQGEQQSATHRQSTD